MVVPIANESTKNGIFIGATIGGFTVGISTTIGVSVGAIAHPPSKESYNSILFGLGFGTLIGGIICGVAIAQIVKLSLNYEIPKNSNNSD